MVVTEVRGSERAESGRVSQRMARERVYKRESERARVREREVTSSVVRDRRYDVIGRDVDICETNEFSLNRQGLQFR